MHTDESIFLSSASLVLATSFLLTAFSGCGDDNAPLNTADESVAINDLRVEDLTATSAWVRFTTSVPTTCEAEYGLAEDTLDQVAVDPLMAAEPFAIDHNVFLENLQPSTVYYYRARVVTPEDQVYRSDIFSFTTPEANPDPSLNNLSMLSTGTTVTNVSSNFGGRDNDSTWGIHNALDGDMNTEWASDGDGDNAFTLLDFGQERAVSAFGFRSRKMSDGSSIVTQVRIIFNPASMTGGTTLGPFDTPDPDQFYRFDFAAPVTARQVRVEVVTSTGGNTGAKEIQFFSADL